MSDAPLPRAERFTAGPWRAELHQPLAGIPITAPDGTVVAYVLGNRHGGNARLIASSPDLLALAKQYASECSGCDGTGEVEVHNADGEPAGEAPCEDCANIRATLAAAEGRS